MQPDSSSARNTAAKTALSPAELLEAEGAHPIAGRAGHPLPVLDLGIAPYEPVQELQGRLRRAVADGVFSGVILLLEHEPVITLGSRGSPDHLCDLSLIRKRNVRVTPSERGGQATLHAPGQLVSYLILPIPGRDLRSFVRSLEETLLVLLGDLGVQGHRREGRPGVYVEEGKIASIGLRCHRWVSSHGTSLNVDIDLSLFDLIVSCGEPGLRQTSLKMTTGHDYDMNVLKRQYVDAACRVFGWELETPRPVPHCQVEMALELGEKMAAGTSAAASTAAEVATEPAEGTS